MLQGGHSAILSAFIKLPFAIKVFVLSILSGRRLTQALLSLLQAELKKKFHEEEAIKYVGFLEQAIDISGKDGFAVGSSVSHSFNNIRIKQHDMTNYVTLL